MDDFEYNSPASELQTSTERIMISEYVATINPGNHLTNDQVFESSTEGLDGLYIFYGMCGILIFFILYGICYSFLFFMKEKAAEKEFEIRRLNERNWHAVYRNPPLNEGRIIIEDFNELPRSPNTLLPREFAECSQAVFGEHESSVAVQGENKECRSTGDVRIPFLSSKETVERKFFPEDFKDLLYQNTTPKLTLESSCGACEISDYQDRIEKWLSTPPYVFPSSKNKDRIIPPGKSKFFLPLVQKENKESKRRGDKRVPFLSPQEIVERKFFPEDFQDHLCPNTTSKQTLVSSSGASRTTDNQDRIYSWIYTPPSDFFSIKSQKGIFPPENSKDLLPPTNREIEMKIQDHENLENKKSDENVTKNSTIGVSQSGTPLEARIQSSPTSPVFVRRRFPEYEDTPRRPSSWR